VRPSGAYGDQARKWKLNVSCGEDLNRDILKADTCSVTIPELDFEMCRGSMGGFFSTVEGVLLKIADHLSTCTPFTGDSANPDYSAAFNKTVNGLRRLASDPESLPFTLILDDPADQSYIGHRSSNPSSEDQYLTSEVYDRTHEQNDELGFTTMKVTDYE